MRFVNEIPGNDRVVNTEIYDVSGCEARRLEHKNGNIIWTLKPFSGKTPFTPVIEMVELLEKGRTKIKNDES